MEGLVKRASTNMQDLNDRCFATFGMDRRISRIFLMTRGREGGCVCVCVCVCIAHTALVQQPTNFPPVNFFPLFCLSFVRYPPPPSFVLCPSVAPSSMLYSNPVVRFHTLAILCNTTYTVYSIFFSSYIFFGQSCQCSAQPQPYLLPIHQSVFVFT